MPLPLLFFLARISRSGCLGIYFDVFLLRPKGPPFRLRTKAPASPWSGVFWTTNFASSSLSHDCLFCEKAQTSDWLAPGWPRLETSCSPFPLHSHALFLWHVSRTTFVIPGIPCVGHLGSLPAKRRDRDTSRRTAGRDEERRSPLLDWPWSLGKVK